MTTLDDLERTVARLEERFELRWNVSPSPHVGIDGWGNPGNVADGEMIEAPWGSAVADRVRHTFPSFAELSTWVAPDGTFATTIADGQEYKYRKGVWVPTFIVGVNHMLPQYNPDYEVPFVMSSIASLPQGVWFVSHQVASMYVDVSAYKDEVLGFVSFAVTGVVALKVHQMGRNGVGTSACGVVVQSNPNGALLEAWGNPDMITTGSADGTLKGGPWSPTAAQPITARLLA